MKKIKKYLKPRLLSLDDHLNLYCSTGSGASGSSIDVDNGMTICENGGGPDVSGSANCESGNADSGNWLYSDGGTCIAGPGVNEFSSSCSTGSGPL